MGCLQVKKKQEEKRYLPRPTIISLSGKRKKNDNRKSQQFFCLIFATGCAFCSYENSLLLSIQAFNMCLKAGVAGYVLIHINIIFHISTINIQYNKNKINKNQDDPVSSFASNFISPTAKLVAPSIK